MNGPDHYRAAEQLLLDAEHFDSEQGAYALQFAQVHATLALAAATAESGDQDRPRYDEWMKATR